MPTWSIRVGARQPAYAANELLEGDGVNEPPVAVEDIVGRCGVLYTAELPDALSGLVIERAGRRDWSPSTPTTSARASASR